MSEPTGPAIAPGAPFPSEAAPPLIELAPERSDRAALPTTQVAG